ncbi:MAG: signal peptide peptidase SppA [Spirochaetota bacterium]|nr:signal peptide peptidase SppA [Spirochaetota bacterium]
MEKNRKIVLSILLLIVLSSILAIIDIGMNMEQGKESSFQISVPQIGVGVGIVRINGPIRFINNGGKIIGITSGAEAIINRLNDLGNDRRIKAIIVRINSPGGTVAATQEIFQKLIKLKKENKILIASMGDIAASGGYYIASACNHIMANYGTITGSIGVIAVSPNLKELFKKIGIKMNVIKSGKYKDLMSSYRDISDKERELLQMLIDSSYMQFLKDVSLGRNVPISDIKPYADGRIVDGRTAMKYKLIDSIGVFEDAINKAREMANLSDDSPVYDDIINPLERFIMSMETIFKSQTGIEERLLNKNNFLIEYRFEP